MVRLENATYRYPGDLPPALLNVSLEIGEGEAVCVMGANGSGKSTLAKIVSGLIKPQQGRFSLGAPKNTPIPVGLLFQNSDNQMVAVTVEKEIAFALENLGVSQPEMDAKIQSTLKRFSIEHLRKRLTAELSVGEKQRVALSALLVFCPPILVLDEPDSFLDQSGKELFRNQIKLLKEQSPELTIIEITQYPQVAREYERLIVFQNGRIAADGQPRSIFQNKSLCVRCGIDFDSLSDKQMELPEEWLTANKSKTPSISRFIFDRVSFRYPGSEKFVLQNFSGEINNQGIVALIGPSGSGKSTLAMLMCGILEPDSGKIRRIDSRGREAEKADIKGRITAALQQPERQFFLHTCLQEVEFGPKNFGHSISRKRIQNFFKMAGLSFEQFFGRDPFTLSLGEKRRLAFGSILSLSPGFIIFDEPTCALDREGVGRFMILAKALNEAGIGIMIISHDEEIVKALADKIIALDAFGNYRFAPREKYFENIAHSSNILAG